MENKIPWYCKSIYTAIFYFLLLVEIVGQWNSESSKLIKIQGPTFCKYPAAGTELSNGLKVFEYQEVQWYLLSRDWAGFKWRPVLKG